MGEITLNGQRAVKVNATLIIWANTPKSQMYNIDGDERWVPNSVSKFTKSGEKDERGNWKGTLLIYEWFYKKELFPNEN